MTSESFCTNRHFAMLMVAVNWRHHVRRGRHILCSVPCYLGETSAPTAALRGTRIACSRGLALFMAQFTGEPPIGNVDLSERFGVLDGDNFHTEFCVQALK